MDQNIELLDNSSDKKYFTMIPNFILLNSSGVEQALYLQMKRCAGENGVSFASENYLAKQLKIGRKGLKKALNSLLKREWIKETGTKAVLTKGGYN